MYEYIALFVAVSVALPHICIDCPLIAEGLRDRQTDRQTDKHTDNWIDRETGRRTGRGGQTERQAD